MNYYNYNLKLNKKKLINNILIYSNTFSWINIEKQFSEIMF